MTKKWQEAARAYRTSTQGFSPDGQTHRECGNKRPWLREVASWIHADSPAICNSFATTCFGYQRWMIRLFRNPDCRTLILVTFSASESRSTSYTLPQRRLACMHGSLIFRSISTTAADPTCVAVGPCRLHYGCATNALVDRLGLCALFPFPFVLS